MSCQCKRLPWSYPGRVPPKGSQGKYSNPPQEKDISSKSIRGCTHQCFSMDTTTMVAGYIHPATTMGKGPNWALDDGSTGPVDDGT